MKILISDAFDAGLPARLEKFGEVFSDASRATEADVVLVRSKTKCTKEYIENAPNLKLIIRGGVGIDNIDTEFAKTKGIEVRNTPAASSVAVAEVAMALMFLMARIMVIPPYWKKVWSIYGTPSSARLGFIWFVLVSTSGVLDIINVFWMYKIYNGAKKIIRQALKDKDGGINSIAEPRQRRALST